MARKSMKTPQVITPPAEPMPPKVNLPENLACQVMDIIESRQTMADIYEAVRQLMDETYTPIQKSLEYYGKPSHWEWGNVFVGKHDGSPRDRARSALQAVKTRKTQDTWASISEKYYYQGA